MFTYVFHQSKRSLEKDILEMNNAADTEMAAIAGNEDLPKTL
jgi:hypothetical protein